MEQAVETFRKVFSKQSLLWFFVAYSAVALPLVVDYLFQNISVRLKSLTAEECSGACFDNILSESVDYSDMAAHILPWWLLAAALIIFPSIFMSLWFDKPCFRFFYGLSILLSLLLVCIAAAAAWRGMWDAGMIILSALMMFLFHILPLTLGVLIYWAGFMKLKSRPMVVLIFSIFVLWGFEWGYISLIMSR